MHCQCGVDHLDWANRSADRPKAIWRMATRGTASGWNIPDGVMHCHCGVDRLDWANRSADRPKAIWRMATRGTATGTYPMA